jgi:hypothetical protein
MAEVQKQKIRPTPAEEQVMSRSVERRLTSGTDWKPMCDAPRDGRYVYFRNDPDMREWYWYKTRNFRRGKWVDVGWWRLRFGDKQPANFQPDGWRLISEGVAEP